MKTKAAVLNSNQYIVLAFLAALLAFVFSAQANAARPSKKGTVVSKALVLKNKSALPSKKINSVMFMNLKQRQLLAQNSSAAAADAKLEGQVMSDSIPVAAPAAANTSITTKLEAKKDDDKKTPHFRGSLSIGTYQSNTSEGRQSYSGSYTLSPSFKIPKEDISIAAKLEYNREYSYELEDGTDGDWGNASVGLTKQVFIGGLIDDISFGPRLSIGMGNESRRQTYKGALTAGITLNKDIGIATVSQSFSYSYRHFGYDIRDNGTVNSPHGLDESTAVSLQITDWMTLQASFGLSYLRSFQGVNRTFSTTGVGAEFALSKNASLGIGAATIKKNTLEPSGQGNRVKLWDSTDAVASIELGISI